VKKDLTTNSLIVAHGDKSELFSTGLTTAGFNWIPIRPKEKEFHCFAKFRYRQADQGVVCKLEGDNVSLTFDTPQRAITQGQFAVLYDKDGNCLGGGEIDKIKQK
jgi:tRNA-specific 2-thiouridylase